MAGVGSKEGVCAGSAVAEGERACACVVVGAAGGHGGDAGAACAWGPGLSVAAAGVDWDWDGWRGVWRGRVADFGSGGGLEVRGGLWRGLDRSRERSFGGDARGWDWGEVVGNGRPVEGTMSDRSYARTRRLTVVGV